MIAAVGALRCALDDDDARAAAKALPSSLAWVLEGPASSVVHDREELYAETARREHVAPGFAVEHTQVVLQALARRLDPELRRRLCVHLPADVAELLEERPEPGEPPAHAHVHPGHAPEPVQTLSRARPGTAEPIADTRHELAHSGSVARSQAPHAASIVETARSTRPGREDETLATTRGGTGRR